MRDDKSIKVFCDGSMQPKPGSPGGVGYIVKFPAELEIPDESDFFGFDDANIERLELQAIIEGMKGLHKWIKKNDFSCSGISRILFITDRFEFQDTMRTSAYKIKEWRRLRGRNHENKEIKNWELLNALDKARTKLSNFARNQVRIEYRQRKLNKEADKLARKGRESTQSSREIAIEGHKIGKRAFDGPPVKCSNFHEKETLILHIFRKRPIREQWEINAEICSEKKKGRTIKIITDHLLQEKLNRRNVFEVKIKKVYTHHIEIYRTVSKLKKEDYI